MDWDFAIERYRVPLLGIVVGLLAEIGLTEGGTVERVSKPLYRFILRRLRTAESAVRRLIFVAARNIVLEPPAERPARKSSGERKGQGKGECKRKRRPSFGLFDPLKRFRRRFKKMRRGPEPRIHSFDEPDPRAPIFRLLGMHPPTAPAPPPVPDVEETVDDGTVDAGPLIRRLLAITDALQDIPRQALRLARWRAKPVEERRPERWSPLRPGRPPGFRQRPKHEVDEILKECHWLALDGHPPLDDTS